MNLSNKCGESIKIFLRNESNTFVKASNLYLNHDLNCGCEQGIK